VTAVGRWSRGLVALCLLGDAACWSAHVYPITSPPSGDGGGQDLEGGGQDLSPDSVTCPGVVLPAGNTTRTLQVGGTSRSYVLHVPSTYDGTKPAPLVLDFHGVGGTGMSELSSSPYPAALDPEGVIMALPDGLKGPVGSAWDVGPCCVADVDDVTFARKVVDDVRSLGCVDPARVYAVGVLTGGGMAHFLACQAADMFAGVAPAAFDLLQENVGECKPSRPITVVSFRGTDDQRVPYAGGASSLVPGMPITFLGAQGTFAKWAEIDGCTGAPSSEDANGCSTYATCQGGVEVVLCTKQDGREEPGVPNVAWPILKRHPR
jgi:polyhydroxybutyrate depolymerase